MKTLKYIPAVAALLSMAACQNEEMQPADFLTDPNAVRIAASVSKQSTRSNPIGSTEADVTNFNDGDKIKVSITDVDASSSAVYVYSQSENVWKPESDYLVWNSTSHKFKASYPSTHTENDNVPADQSTPELIATADYMLFPETSIDKSDQISLSMARQTARVVINVGEIIWKNQFKDYEIFSITMSDGKTTEIKPCLYEGTYYALLLPTENEASDATFMQITVWDGKNEETKEPLTIKGIPSHDAGKSYTYTLILGRDKVAIGDVTVANWDTGSILNTNVEGQTNEQQITDNGGGYCYVSSINTYFVYTSDGLKNVRGEVESKLSANITLMNNISIPLNIQGSLRYANWEPIGTSGHYNGIFNGNGKTITGLTNTNGCGLIQDLGQYGVVKDLTMENAQVTGTSYCGAVVGKNHGGLISGCIVNNSSIQGSSSGGIVGSNSAPEGTTKGGTVVGCKVTNSTLTDASGIVGLNEKEAKVIGCFAYGNNVNKFNSSGNGGIVTRNTANALVIGCYAYQCNNNGSALAGDINIYNSNDATVTNCYYTTSTGTFGACGGTATNWEQALAAMNAAIISYGWHWSGTQDAPTLGKETSDSTQE